MAIVGIFCERPLCIAQYWSSIFRPITKVCFECFLQMGGGGFLISVSLQRLLDG